MFWWLDSTACAVVLYTVAGSLALLLGLTERQRRRRDDRPDYWPAFWFTTAGLLLVMALGRVGDVSDLLTEIGREQARSGGWYDVRRAFQAWGIGVVAAVWAVIVAIAIWRVPERRRRFLPTAVAVFTLVCYIGVRLVSLHQVDAVLHNREVEGVTIGAFIEDGLLLLVIAVSSWRFRRPNGGRIPATPPVSPVEPAVGSTAGR